MKLLTFKYNGMEQVGVLAKDELSIHPISGLGFTYQSMNELIEFASKEELEKLSMLSKQENGSIKIDQIKKEAPIPVPRQDILCLGVNFLAHAEESANFKKISFDRSENIAVYFSKRVNRAVADGDPIDSHEDINDSLDYEVELAVIIAKDARNVSLEEAFDYVFGYTIINDISARNLQGKHKQWYFGKSLDDFTPMGPWIVTKDEFINPPILKISSRVNGELRQDSSTKLFITSIEEAICELSKGMTLKAGTIISMGTPSGVGMGFTPPKFLNKGDIVECEIEGIGSLKNPVK